jgi:hypothetical protein
LFIFLSIKVFLQAGEDPPDASGLAPAKDEEKNETAEDAESAEAFSPEAKSRNDWIPVSASRDSLGFPRSGILSFHPPEHFFPGQADLPAVLPSAVIRVS